MTPLDHPPAPPLRLPPPVARPGAVLVARCAAGVQVAVSAAAAGWFGYCGVTVPVGRHPEDYGEVWQVVCAAGAALAVLMTLLVAVPALLLRRGGSAARVVLIVVEFACAVPVLFALSMALNGRGLAGYAAVLAVHALGGGVIVAAVFSSDVREWSES